MKRTYPSPACDFRAEGERTGEYLLDGEIDAERQSESVVGYADYAVAAVDEIIAGKRIDERISVVGK